jgi:hypothetical protein
MNWLINKVFKWGKNDYRVRLNMDKNINSPKFAYPATWTGEIAGYIEKTGQLERGSITLKQKSKEDIERVEFPEFASGIYDDLLKEIHGILRPQIGE